jgi:repressor LexA
MIGQNIRYLRKRAGISQKQIAEKLGVTQGSVSQWENEATEPDTRTIGQLAKVFSVPVDFFFSDEPRRELDSIRIMRNAVPIVGEIACGTPVTAEQNIEGYADVPDGVHADFALRCKGDSMEPTFMHGDLVLIRQTPDFSPGR